MRCFHFILFYFLFVWDRVEDQSVDLKRTSQSFRGSFRIDETEGDRYSSGARPFGSVDRVKLFGVDGMSPLVPALSFDRKH